MGITVDYGLNTDRQEVYDFLAEAVQTWTDQPPPCPGYTYANLLKDVGVVNSGDVQPALPHGTLTLTWARQENWAVWEGVDERAQPPVQGSLVASFSVTVLVQQPVQISVKAALYVQSGIENNPAILQKIRDAFSSFDPTQNIDPDDYVRSRIAADPTLSKDMAAIKYTYSLTKAPGEVTHDEELKSILALYRGQADGSIKPGPNEPPEPIHHNDPPSGYFHKRGFRVVKSGDQLIGRPPAKRRDVHEIETDQPARVIDEITGREAEGAGCSSSDYELQQHRIMELLRFPEFKVVWRDFAVKVGCVRVVLTLPIIQARESSLELWAYSRYPKNLGALVEKVILNCLWEAVLAGAVVGAVLGNFPAAIAAFRALFVECLKAKFKEFIACLIPGIALNTAVMTDWHDL